MARDLPPDVAKTYQEIVDGAFGGEKLRSWSRVLKQIPPGTYTKGMLCLRTGLSMKELRALEARGILRPIGFSRNNYAYYDDTTIELLKRRHKKTTDELRAEIATVLPEDPRRPYDAAEGKKVFQLIDQGKSLKQIVLETDLHPVTVKAIHADYEDCEGGVFIPARLVEELNKLEGKLDGRFPLTDAHAIYDVLMRASRGLQCISCGGKRNQAATLCRPCAREGAAGFKREMAPHASIPQPSVERARAAVQGTPMVTTTRPRREEPKKTG